MYVCMYVCVYIYIYTYIYVSVCVCICVCVARFLILFAWSLERMRMHINALFYLHIIFIRLHELAWHSDDSIKCQTFECHSNG